MGANCIGFAARQQSESKFSNAVLERAIKARATIRTLGTVTKLAAKYTA